MAYQEILSVGIDIGTSTTQTVFSRLGMQNTAGYFAVPKIEIISKNTIYKSHIHLTPLKTGTIIDTAEVKKLVAADFAEAGFSPKDTSTGAVIITGEAARKENAAAVLNELAGFAGEFVVSTAGPDLESVIAGKGSGAWQHSLDNACSAVNLDIGGGTTNIVLFDNGETLSKGCLDIGGRQIRVSNNKITYISESAQRVANSLGINIRVSDAADTGALARICDKMAELLEDAVAGRTSALMESVVTKGSSPYSAAKRPYAVFFSGGVADCIFKPRNNPFEYGDIGGLLGRAIRARRFFADYNVVAGEETIRATVVGAGSYTTSISGSTIFYSRELFPLKNVQALRLSSAEQDECFGGGHKTLEEKIKWYIKETDSDRVIVALEGDKDPSYAQVKLLAKGLAQAVDNALPQGAPALISVENDIAKVLGQTVYGLLEGRREVVTIDSVRLGQGDYIDMGKPLMGGLAIPVVVKSLIFDN